MRVNGGEIAIKQCIALSGNVDGGIVEVAASQHVAVCHVPFGILHDELPEEFKFNDGNGLVHACVKQPLFFCRLSVAAQIVGVEKYTVVVPVSFECKGGQGYKVYTISFLKYGRVSVT